MRSRLGGVLGLRSSLHWNLERRGGDVDGGIRGSLDGIWPGQVLTVVWYVSFSRDVT